MLPNKLNMPYILSLLSLIIIFSMLNYFFLYMKPKNYLFTLMKGKKSIKYLSLFTSFDPQSSVNFFFFNNLNWLVLLIIPFMVFISFWHNTSRLNSLEKNFLNTLSKQFSIALKTKKDGTSFFFSILFYLFFLTNILGLVPNVFTSSSHITFNLMFSISLWMGFFLFGWVNHTNKMFSHLVPLSTPNLLISFMVLIELTSTVIRPLTLSIRMMANMVSGHLLLTLLGNSMMTTMLYVLTILIILQSILCTLEMSVSMIQSYVFCMLLTLYSDESEYK